MREFDAQTLVDIYNVRASLERTAIRLVARRGMDTAPLRQLIDAMAEAARAGKHHDVAHRELEFHAVLCASAENQVLTNIFHGLEGQMLMALALDDSAYQNLDEVAKEHQPLIDAIEARDEAAAARAMDEHILSTIGAVIDRLGGSTERLLTPL
ncbi:FCD domain-containing protein [Qaidamihabitans albus]|uniref:FCD domain-containing protein n=1 Tax=Qaidamihabitans albus TaxID=2795733 RepID=UPI0027DB2C04|nr:FCD domain-containing protein [Qaidamihabitans albus]